MGKNEDRTFEQKVEKIDEIVTLLEKGDAQLDKSLQLFEEGVKLIEECGVMLSNAEQKVVSLQKTATGECQHSSSGSQSETMEQKEFLFDDDE